MKVAIVHYWLVGVRGGEKVLEALCELYPGAVIFTHAYNKDEFCDSIISKHEVRTTFIARLPFSKKNCQKYLPLMPLALEQIDLSGFDLVISSESGPAKGVIPPPGVPHICYCHSPMRYAWDMYHSYTDSAGVLKRIFLSLFMHYIRRWDQLTSTQVTQFVANSSFVASRLKSYYGRKSIIIHPPVDCDKFSVSYQSDNFYLMLGQIVDYKRFDLAVDAFNELGL